MSYWEELERPGPEAVTVSGVELRRRSRVRLRPRPGGDVFDLALAGRTAVVERIDEDMEGNLRLAVIVDDDPGRDLGEYRRPGHRFFFAPEEVEPLADEHRPGPVVAARGGVRAQRVGRVGERDERRAARRRQHGVRGAKRPPECGLAPAAGRERRRVDDRHADAP